MTLYLSNRDGNGKTSEEGHYKFQTSVWTGNVLGSLALKVSQNTTPGMSVIVAAGQFKIDTATDYSYTGWNTADTVVNISTADPSNPRITSIIAYVDKGAATSASPPNNPGIVKLIAVNGTPAASPTAPSAGTIQTAVGSGNPYIILANVTVNAGATSILNASISDQRSLVTVGTALVATSSIVDSAVTTVKIADSAVTAAKIADNSITSTKLANASINITKMYNPYRFAAYRSGSQAAGVVVFNVEFFDTNNNYNTTNGRYTAPVSGFYFFSANVSQSVSAAPQDPQTIIRKNGSTTIGYSHFVNMYNGASSGSANSSVLIQLNAGDYVDVVINRGTDGQTTGNNFSGFLVSPT